MLRTRFYPRARLCVVQTQEVGNYLAGKGLITAEKTCVIPSAIRIPSFDLHQQNINRTSNSQKTLLYVGRLSNEKRVDRLLTAWSKLEPKYATWRLRIVGDGSERVPLQQFAASLGIERTVDWSLWITDVWGALLTANAFCLVSEYEGFPQSMLEAMASGLPVAVLDCSPAIRQTITDSMNGLIIPNEEQIFCVLDRLLQNESLQTALGQNASIRARDFEWSVIASKWINAIQTAYCN